MSASIDRSHGSDGDGMGCFGRDPVVGSGGLHVRDGGGLHVMDGDGFHERDGGGLPVDPSCGGGGPVVLFSL